MRLLNIGSLNIDHFYAVDRFVQPGETNPVLSHTKGSGGKGLNQSIAAARAGLEVLHLGRIGNDGHFLLDELTCAGVDTSYIRKTGGEDGHTVIQVDAAGQNCILVVGGANMELELDDICSALDAMSPGDVVLLQNETNLVAETIRLAHQKELRVAFNPSPVNSEVSSFPLGLVTWLFINETEGEALTGKVDPKDILDALQLRLPATEIILTLGAGGSIWAHANTRESCPARHVTAVDTTAAGDTFTGFFLRGVLEPLAGVSPLILASTAASLTVCRSGAAASIPGIDEVIEALECI